MTDRLVLLFHSSRRSAAMIRSASSSVFDRFRRSYARASQTRWRPAEKSSSLIAWSDSIVGKTISAAEAQ
jgi:hypothetical protein